MRDPEQLSRDELLEIVKRYDAEHAAIREHYERWRKEGEYIYPRGGLAEDMLGAINYFERKYSAVLEAYAAFQEHSVVSLSAMHMIAKSTYGMTHKQISARLDVLCDTINEAIRLMVESRSSGIDSFVHTPYNRKDWDFRHIAAENHKLQNQLGELQKQIAANGHVDANEPAF